MGTGDRGGGGRRRRVGTRTPWVVAVAVALLAAACSSGGQPEATPPTVTTESPGPSTSAVAPTTEGRATSTTGATEPAPPPVPDRAWYILPPGNYGGLPPNDDSRDQLPLYDGLTPLRDDVTDADLERYFLPEDFEPVGATVAEPTGRDGLTILYDEYGVAHITGETREDLAFGAGWVGARDRGLLISLGRGPARVAVADVPGIDAFSLVTSGQGFVPSGAAEQLVTDQVDLIEATYGDEGRQIIADAGAYADGVNAYWEANGVDQPPFTVNDVIATSAFIGSIFGAGGGSEAANAEFLSRLRNTLGEERGRRAWEDLLGFDDPEAPTTIETRFEYPVLTGGEVTGSVEIDEGSIESIDVLGGDNRNVAYPAAGEVPARKASNFLIVDGEHSTHDTTLAVMGPQLGYFYPEIVQQIHLRGPGIEAQGVGVPGMAMYLLIGRTPDYAWSLTSATHDVRDVYAEILCNPDGSPPTRGSDHYEFDGECVPFEMFDAGNLGGTEIVYPTTVHGPVVGTALSEGRPVALSRRRSTFGRDGLNLAALKGMTEGEADTPEAFWDIANRFGFTFNWGYASREAIAYFSSGYLPERAPGLDRRLPTLGTGDYEWRGFLDRDHHPHAEAPASGRLLNWNNQSAPGFMHGDDNPYGSVHRVELFDGFPDRVDLAGVVGIMNRSATESTSSPMWEVVVRVLRGGPAPSPLAGEALDVLDAWVRNDAPILDVDEDGENDDPGALLAQRLFDPVRRAVLGPVFGDLVDELRGVSPESLIDKDLRTVMGEEVRGPYNLGYCGLGSLPECRASLWAAVDEVARGLADEFGPDPAAWLGQARTLGFVPGLIPDTFRATNRPTFQQVLEFGAG